MTGKVFTIFAGVNGAGKSSLYNFENKDFGVRINFDEIIKENFDHDWSNPAVQAKAGAMAVRLVKNCLAGSMSFNQETTLTGNVILRNIKKAKENGFRIDLYYVGLESVELSIERVDYRKSIGGHGIPEIDLRRRYANSFQNLKVILPICDVVRIFDNSLNNSIIGMSLELIVENGEAKYQNQNMSKYFKDVLSEYLMQIKTP